VSGGRGPSDVARKRELDALYAELPAIGCQRLCQEACGPVLMGRVEWERIVKRLKHEPRGGPDLVCPMLRDGLCSVYAIRPMICRLWGIVEGMECPWGCVPERLLTREEGFAYLGRANEIAD
jgi:Fe-S-cluster containining protein